MLIRKGEVNIFITDESVGIYQNALNKKSTAVNSVIELDQHIVENGYIVDPEALYLKLKQLFKQNKISPKSVNMVIHDQNILIRQFEIDKENLQKKSIISYIHEQEGRTIHFPFEDANITYYVKSENEESISAVVIISDENLLQDYYDVFDRLGVRFVSFNVAPRVLNRLYENEYKKEQEQLMIVSLYSNMITINILEHSIPVFGMIEESEGSTKQYYELVENYIERVANYYRFNIKKGTGSISNVIIYNFNKQLTNKDIKEKIKPELENLELVIYETLNSPLDAEGLNRYCTMAYASSIRNSAKSTHMFNFTLDRVNRINKYANYLLVLAFTIFTMITLVYIPYMTYSEDISIQENINNILQNQLATLIEDTPISPSTTKIERDYSNSYDFLIGQVDQSSTYIESLLSEISGSLNVERYTLNSADNQIKIVISATSEAELYEYLVVIYEAYGITNVADDSRWIVSQPERRFITSLLMEVTITYA